MMVRSLYAKIILIMVIFIITVMSVVGTVLLNSVNHFYTEDFLTQMEQNFAEDGQLYPALVSAASEENYLESLKAVLQSFSARLGIDSYRNYYILDADGTMLDGSDESLGQTLSKTGNMLAAMNGLRGSARTAGTEYTDYAIPLSGGDNRCIIYIKDTQEDMQQLNWILFSIILQALLIGLLIALLLAFFLSRAITQPIRSLTHGAQLIAAGEFSHELDVHSTDEIGTLTDTFNHMKQVLKNTLDEVEGERAKLETVFACLADGVIAFTDDGKLLHLNESASQLLEEGEVSPDAEDFNFEQLLDLFSIAYRDGKFENRGEGEVTANETAEGEATFGGVVFAGRVLEVTFGHIRYNEENQMHNGVIVVIHDMTGRYELDKSRREFVANVSHELRTPLTSIKGACETLHDHPELPDEIKTRFLEMAISESDRMTSIVRDLLVLSRLDNQRTHWNITEFDLNASLSRMVDVMQVEAVSRNQTLQFVPEEGDMTITGDAERIEQVILNLVSNAVKYTPEGGNILVRSGHSTPDSVFVSVRDNGIGIPEEDQPRLFERFYRVEKARTSGTGGTGLGLAIAKELVEAHGGRIALRSKLNVGTLMVVELPRQTKLKSTED
ncbi:MAG: cell wall metabolism sensor histidine kinase WalK [Ruminococcaceae bacterium]|nr:cell wall metabolism sensor histidine kinase WalK [Oscillospiraceae bacterium]